MLLLFLAFIGSIALLVVALKVAFFFLKVVFGCGFLVLAVLGLFYLFTRILV